MALVFSAFHRSLKAHGLAGFHGKINFELCRGEVIGVAGLRGQGQSHLVRELFAIDKPIKLNYLGTEDFIKNPSEAVKKKFAFVSGNWEWSFGNHSIAENISVVSELILAGIMLLELSSVAILKMGDGCVMMSIAAAVIGGVKGGERRGLGAPKEKLKKHPRRKARCLKSMDSCEDVLSWKQADQKPSLSDCPLL